MKNMYFSILIIICGLVALDCRAGESVEKLESCYDAAIVAVQNRESPETKTTEILSEDQMLNRCNQKVINQAKSEKDVAQIMTLAGVIGRKSNWAAAAPVYVIAAKLDQKKTCQEENTVLSMKTGVAHPADFPTVKGAKLLMEACWPEDQSFLTHLITEADDDYTKLSVCPFLQSHKATLTKLGKSICEGLK